MNDNGRIVTDGGEEEHTLIHVICDECGGCDMLTLLEHPRDSQQVSAVSDAHHTMAEGHADETGHHVEVGSTAGEPNEIRRAARSMADSVAGADADDFPQPVATDGRQAVGEDKYSKVTLFERENGDPTFKLGEHDDLYHITYGDIEQIEVVEVAELDRPWSVAELEEIGEVEEMPEPIREHFTDNSGKLVTDGGESQ